MERQFQLPVHVEQSQFHGLVRCPRTYKVRSSTIFSFIFTFPRPYIHTWPFRWILRAEQSGSIEDTNTLGCLEKWGTFVVSPPLFVFHSASQKRRRNINH